MMISFINILRQLWPVILTSTSIKKIGLYKKENKLRHNDDIHQVAVASKINDTI